MQLLVGNLFSENEKKIPTEPQALTTKGFSLGTLPV